MALKTSTMNRTEYH